MYSLELEFFFWGFFNLSNCTKIIFSTIRTENTLPRISPAQTEDTTSYHLDICLTEASETLTEVRTQYWRFKTVKTKAFERPT